MDNRLMSDVPVFDDSKPDVIIPAFVLDQPRQLVEVRDTKNIEEKKCESAPMVVR